MRVQYYIFKIVVVFFIFSSIVQADEITLSYKDVTLNANLQLAANKQLADGVILITHGGLAHNGMEIIVALQNQLNAHGYSTLAINLSLGLDKRHGMYDCKVTHRHRNTDAVNEIDTWMGWLNKQGVKQVILLGHSRGGAQTALYEAERDNSMVKSLILMSPAIAENTDAAEYQKRFNMPLQPLLDIAQKRIREGKGDAVINFIGLMTCANTSATADSFTSYYEQSSGLDTPHLIPKFSKPALIIVAGGDEIVVGLDKKMTALVDGNSVQMKVIVGADHLYRDLYTDDAVDVIDTYLKQNK